MSRAFSGGKRQREAERDRRKKAKQDRLRQNRAQRAHGMGDADVMSDPGGVGDALPEVKLEDVVISVAPRPRTATDGPTKLFVGGLSFDTTTEDLRDAFARFGSVLDAAVIPDRSTGRSRGFGFVTFEHMADAMQAIEKMNGAELDGRTLKVNRAEAR
jgi:hypothetical protein